ncbi:hypothetical protein H4R33_003997 [Dimargaris cristalligena]|nr:hypothetical protein H4R33_003997 [Dimargaris cristalligena]
MRALISVFALVGLHLSQVTSQPPGWLFGNKPNNLAEPIVIADGARGIVSHKLMLSPPGLDDSAESSSPSSDSSGSIPRPIVTPNAEKILKHWDMHFHTLKGLLDHEVSWNKASRLWYNLAPLETWDVYMASIRPREDEDIFDFDDEADWPSLAAPKNYHSPQSPLGLVGNQPMARALLRNSHRVPFDLDGTSEETLRREFPLAWGATNKHLAWLTKLLPIRPHLSRTRNQRGMQVFATGLDSSLEFSPNLEDLDQRHMEYNQAQVIIPVVVDRIITTALWRLHGQNDWESIKHYFETAEALVYGSATPADGDDAPSEQAKLIGQHARFVATLAALNDDSKRTDWMREYVTFGYTTGDADLPRAMHYQCLYVDQLYQDGLTVAAEHLEEEWFDDKSCDQATKGAGGLPYLNNEYMWLDDIGNLHTTVPSLGFRKSPLLGNSKTTPPEGWKYREYAF